MKKCLKCGRINYFDGAKECVYCGEEFEVVKDKKTNGVNVTPVKSSSYEYHTYSSESPHTFKRNEIGNLFIVFGIIDIIFSVIDLICLIVFAASYKSGSLVFFAIILFIFQIINAIMCMYIGCLARNEDLNSLSCRTFGELREVKYQNEKLESEIEALKKKVEELTQK